MQMLLIFFFKQDSAVCLECKPHDNSRNCFEMSAIMFRNLFLGESVFPLCLLPMIRAVVYEPVE